MKTRTMRIYKKYFDMIKNGVKTVEIRVAYPSMAKIQKGDVIKFNGDPNCACEVLRVSKYSSFAEMMQNENPKAINPYEDAETQLRAIRKIFPPRAERLGVLVFELRKL